MHPVVASGAEEFEAELEAPHMMSNALRQRQRSVEVRGVDGEIKRRCHCESSGDGGMSLTRAGAGAVAGTGGAGTGSAARLAIARRSASCRSLVSSRRFKDQRAARSAIHIGRLPRRNATTISTGNLVSSTWPGQMVTATGFQFAIANRTS